MKYLSDSLLRLVLVGLVLWLATGLYAGEPFRFGTAVRPDGQTLYVDGTGILLNNEYVLPVMGEIHFSRIPEKDWKREILKMKAGGIDIAASYVFWNHHESKEGVMDWSGNRNLRKYLETCRDCGMMVVLRVGPYCHGEVYLGGLPEWMVDKAAADPENVQFTGSELAGFCEEAGFLPVEMRIRHVYALETLEREEEAPPHHDPFDRMLIAQAKTENMLFLTHDSLLPFYNEKCIVPV